jgi:hypothetical protein
MGRRFGDKNKATKRAENAARQRAFRERQREKADAEAEAGEQQDRFFREMRAEGLLFWGETSPTINCINIAEEIEMARLWAKLLSVRDIQPGENQKAYILEVMLAWCLADCPLLHLDSRTLSNRKVDVPDVKQYVWPENSDTPYQDESETKEVTNV